VKRHRTNHSPGPVDLPDRFRAVSLWSRGWVPAYQIEHLLAVRCALSIGQRTTSEFIPVRGMFCFPGPRISSSIFPLCKCPGNAQYERVAAADRRPPFGPGANVETLTAGALRYPWWNACPGPSRSLSFPHLVDFWTVNPAVQNHGSPPCKNFQVLYQIRVWPPEEAEPGQSRSISSAANQPPCELSPSPQLDINLPHPLFAVFEFPVELFLSILSHISPEPQLTGHYARFREQYCMEINDDHQKRVRFLRPLSMTCRLMRLRLVPWMWNLIEPSRGCWYDLRKGLGWNLTAIANALHTDTFLAASVRYFCPSVPFFVSVPGLICVFSRFMTVHFPWNDETSPQFVECLKSLPNLHTLEIGEVYDRMGLACKRDGTTLLEGALEGVELPQIETLILPPAIHLLVKHCTNVENLDWVIRDKYTTSDEFLESLASIQDSKIKRLAIPLVLEGNPSRE